MRIDLLQLLQCAQHFTTDMHHRPKDTTAGDAEGHRQVVALFAVSCTRQTRNTH